VAAEVLGAGGAAAVAVEAGQRVEAAGLERAAEDVALVVVGHQRVHAPGHYDG